MQDSDGAVGWDSAGYQCHMHLGPKCLQMLGMHALSGCDTTSYPYGQGKIRALSTLLSGDFSGLADVLGEVGTTQADLMEAAKPFFNALYRQRPGTSMESARFYLFTKKKKSPKVMTLPPTSDNLLQGSSTGHVVESSRPPSST